MADDEKIITSFIDQNPSEVDPSSQDFLNKKRSLVEKILETFKDLLPSNYISQTTGPYYTVQFQAIAEQLAILQITIQEIFKDLSFDFTRSEFLYQFIGSLVFPDVDETGFPELEGDLTFRNFFSNMVELLIQGATLDSVEKGIELLTDADVDIIEKYLAARNTKNSLWGLDEQFEFEINISGEDCLDFPEDPFILQRNIILVLRALKPAHTIYTYRNLFKESFGTLFEDSYDWEYEDHFYDDTRKYCDGAKNITGGERLLFSDSGQGFSGNIFFSDNSVDFFTSMIKPGNVLVIEDTLSEGAYEVVQVNTSTEIEVTPSFPATFSSANWVILNSSGGDTLEDRFLFSDANRSFKNIRPYSYLKILPVAEHSNGSVIENSNSFIDTATNFIALSAQEGDTLKIAVGPNSGTYTISQVISKTEIELSSSFSTTESTISWSLFSPNTGEYRIREILSVPLPNDSTNRAYETFPSGLNGTLVVEDGIFRDTSTSPTDFSTAVPGEILVIEHGPNKGSYRLEYIPGEDGGPLGISTSVSDKVVPSLSILRLDKRMPVTATGQPYNIEVDRLGVQIPKKVCREDVSVYFAL